MRSGLLLLLTFWLSRRTLLSTFYFLLSAFSFRLSTTATPQVSLPISAQAGHAQATRVAASGAPLPDSAYIRRAESDWAESMASNDASVLERVLADDFVETAIDGTRLFKAQVITWYKTHHSEFAFNHLDKMWMRVSGDAAITQGTEIWKKKDGTSGKYVWTDTWVKRGGSWQVIASASQATIVTSHSPSGKPAS
jgi:ketosteroid isomerase-like protein